MNTIDKSEQAPVRLSASAANILGLYFPLGDPLGDQLSAAYLDRVTVTTDEARRLRDVVDRERLDPKTFQALSQAEARRCR